MPEKEPFRVAAIIPAFNEQKTIGPVIDAVQACSSISEIIIIDDGSKDKTGVIALEKKAKVIRHSKNLGKGQAMQSGSKETKASWLIFIDADLIGLKVKHLEALIDGVRKERFDMSIGAVDRRQRWGIIFLRFFNRGRLTLSGTRVMSRDFWESIPLKYKKKFHTETAISYIARKRSLKTKAVLLEGVKHLIKEKKRGLVLGIFHRLRMTGQIAWINILIRLSDV